MPTAIVVVAGSSTWNSRHSMSSFGCVEDRCVVDRRRGRGDGGCGGSVVVVRVVVVVATAVAEVDCSPTGSTRHHHRRTHAIQLRL